MLNDTDKLTKNQRKDIAERFRSFLDEIGMSLTAAGRELNVSQSVLSEICSQKENSRFSDKKYVAVHNWIELAARRHSLIRSREFVETAVAEEILTVAKIVAETCQIGVVFGPARIGKTMTLEAIEGDHAFGDPKMVVVKGATSRPFALCRAICEQFDLSTQGSYDRVLSRLIERLKGTKRMLIFDEADKATYPALEMIRQLHDATGCPILLSGKPAIYEHLGFRQVGGFSERLDQMAGRIVMKRDLTERTRGENPEPLYRISDIKKLISQSGIVIRVSPEAVKWLRDRSSQLGMGGIGKAMVNLYLAFKIAQAQGAESVSSRHLDDADLLTLGSEDAAILAQAASEGFKIRKVV